MPKDLVVHLKKKTPPFTFSSFHVLFGCLMIASPNSIANERFDRRVPIIDHVHDDKKRGGRSGGWGECTSALRITKVRRGGKMFGVSASFSPFHRCEMKGLGGWLACVRACVCVCVCVGDIRSTRTMSGAMDEMYGPRKETGSKPSLQVGEKIRLVWEEGGKGADEISELACECGRKE